MYSGPPAPIAPRDLAIELPELPDAPQTLSIAEVLQRLGSSSLRLSRKLAAERLEHFGPNGLPVGKPPTLVGIFRGQFKSPLISVLLLAALVSLGLREYTDAGFIFAVLLFNAIIGTIQELGAERSAQALQRLVASRSGVVRGGETLEVDTHSLVPGDIVMLESGGKIPADLRLLEAHTLTIDESMLTGESVATEKDPGGALEASDVLGDRANMAFAGCSFSISLFGR